MTASTPTTLHRLTHTALLAVVAIASAAGCSASVPKGKISGTVTYDGKPLESGSISFMPAKTGIPVSAEISGGQYVATEVPQGELFVSVVSVKQPQFTDVDRDAENKRREEIRKQSEEKVKDGEVPIQTRPDFGRRGAGRPESLIPRKYADPSRSELKFTLSSSEATFNVELVPDPNEPKDRPGRGGRPGGRPGQPGQPD